MGKEGLDAIIGISSETLENIQKAESRIQELGRVIDDFASKMVNVNGEINTAVQQINDNFKKGGITLRVDTDGLSKSIAAALNMSSSLVENSLENVSKTVDREKKEIESKKIEIISDAEMQRQTAILKDFFSTYYTLLGQASRIKNRSDIKLESGKIGQDDYEKAIRYANKMEIAASKTLTTIAKIVAQNDRLTDTETYLSQAESMREHIASRIVKIKKEEAAAQKNIKTGSEAFSFDPKGVKNYSGSMDVLSTAFERLRNAQTISNDMFREQIALLDGTSPKLEQQRVEMEAMSAYYKELEKSASKDAAVQAANETKVKAYESQLKRIEEMDTSSVAHLREQLSKYKSLYWQIAKASDTNPLISQEMVEGCKNRIKSVETELQRLASDKAIAKDRTKLEDVLGMDEETISEVKKKITSIKNELRVVAKNANNAFVAEDAQRLNNKLGELKGRLDDVRGSSEKVYTSASKLGGLFSRLFSVYTIGRFLKEMVQIRGEFEYSEKALGAILQDTEKAKSIFLDLQKIAIRSPFQIKEMVAQTKQLSAYRIEADKLVETNKMLGDISAALGVDMNRLILAYGQVKAATVLKGTELRQFSEAGVNMLGGLAERFSELNGRIVTTGEVLGMITKKMVSFEDVDAVLRKMTDVGGVFYKMQEQQADTIKGMISNLRDRLDMMFNDMGERSETAIKGLIRGVEWLLSNYQVVLGTMASIFAFSGISKFLSGLVLVKDKLGDIKTLIGGIFKMRSIAGAAEGLGMLAKLGPQIAAISAAFLALVTVLRKLTKVQREIKNITSEVSDEITNQQSEFLRLKSILESSTTSYEAKTDALKQMKDEFGNILPLQKESVETINLESDAYKNAAQSISLYNTELLRQKLYEYSVNNLESMRGKTIEKLSKKIQRVTKNVAELREKYPELSMIDENGITIAWSRVEEQIKEGAYSTAAEVQSAFANALKELYGFSAPAITKLFANIFGESGGDIRIWNRIKDIIKPFKKYSEEVEKQDNLIFGANTKEIRDNINNIEKEYNAFIDRIKKEAESKGAPITQFQAEKMAQEYLLGLQSALNEQIAGIKDTDIAPEQKNKLKSLLESKIMALKFSDFDSALNDMFVDAFEKFPEVSKSTAFRGQLRRAQDESVKSLYDRIEELQTKSKNWLNEYNNAVGDTKKAMIARGIAQDMGETVESLTQEVELMDYLLPMLKLLVPPEIINKKQTDEYQQNLKSFVQEVRNAIKEFDSLDAEGDKLLTEKLKILGNKVGEEIPDNFAEINIEDWLQSVEKKINKENSIELKLTVNKENTEDTINSLKEDLDRIWDDYEIAKKAKDLGISLTNISVDSAYAQLLEKERELRAINTKESLESARDNANKRLKILRDEQEEAMRIMSETQKEALSKTQQAYESMYTDIGHLSALYTDKGDFKVDPGQVSDTVIKRVENGFKAIADAEWEAYKSTEMYTMAFGDLEGISQDVIRSLKDGLEDWSRNNALNPTEIAKVEKAIEKMNKKLQKAPTGGLFDIFSNIKSNFDEFKRLRDEVVPGYESALRTATMYQQKASENLALAKKNFADKQLQEALAQEAAAKARTEADLAISEGNIQAVALALSKVTMTENDLTIAKEELKTATDNLTEAQDAYTNSLNHTDTVTQEYKDSVSDMIAKLDALGKELEDLKSSYDDIGDAISSLTGLLKDFADTFGLTMSEDMTDGLEAFTNGFALLGSSISSVSSAITAVKTAANALNISLATLETLILPLAIVGVTIGGLAAYFKVMDNRKKRDVENLRKEVDNLSESFDKLSEAMERSMTLTDIKLNYDTAVNNLKEQKEKLLEAISVEESRGAKKDSDAIDEMEKQISEIDGQLTDLKDNAFSTLGIDSDWKSLADNWSTSWLDAFKETGDGLEALNKSFDEFYEGIIVKELSNLIMGKQIEKLKEKIDEFYSDDLFLDDEERAQLLAIKGELKGTNESLKQAINSLGIASEYEGSGDTLQKGIQSVTETTASAIEAYLDSIRYYVHDNNTVLRKISSAFVGTEDTESPVLRELKMHTTLLQSIDRLLLSVSSTDPMRGKGLRVFIA